MTTHIDDADPDAVWEPWTPVVGQRVRLSRSAECVCPNCGHGHILTTDGEIATVLGFGPYAKCSHCAARVHSHTVHISTGSKEGMAAVAELEPLEDEG